MKITNYNDNWKFWEITNSFALNWNAPEDARIVTLPHDAMIEKPQEPDCKSQANTGYRSGGIYSYSKNLYAQDPSRTYILKIEGAYMNSFVYVNGELAAKRPYGYSIFYVPLNNYLEFGKENEIRIQVRSSAEPNSRWYSGTGLYRDVYLMEAGERYIIPDSVQITTLRIPDDAGTGSLEDKEKDPVANRKADIRVEAHINAPSGEKPEKLEIKILDCQGKEITRTSIPVDGTPERDSSATALHSHAVAGEFAPEELADAYYYPVTATLEIAQPQLWDADHPHLYTCILTLEDASGNALDTHCDRFGIRTITADAQHGLRINNQQVKLRGACIHHDSGILGAKTYEEAHFRQIRILKESGFNAIRSSHNPAAPALLRACDALGMYVMDETFDMWTRHKSDYDYAMYFEEWWEADVEALVRNDYNHPSVIMYSVGNEIPEICTPQGGRITKLLCEKVKSLDPTRLTTASVNGIFCVGDRIGQIVMDVAADLASQGKSDGNVNDFMAFMHEYMNDMTSHPIIDECISVPFQHTDVAGYNYMGSRYDIEHPLHPDRVVVGSETGIADISYNWTRVLKYPHVIGDFCWTGWEYLGESGIGAENYSKGSNPFGNAKFPLQISGTGCIDFTGHRLPMSYYREIIFGLRKDPYIAVQDPAHHGEELVKNPWIITDAIDSWTWNGYEGKDVTVEVYSDAQEVELFRNGKSLGRKPAGEGHDFKALFEVTYTPGTLLAVSYAQGKETGRFEISSASKNLHLAVKLEETEAALLSASSHDSCSKPGCSAQDTHCSAQDTYFKASLSFVQIAFTDEQGIIAADHDEDIHVTIEGSAQLLGFGSAQPKPSYNYNETTAHTWHGRAQLIVQKPSDGSVSTITIKADSGLASTLVI